MMKMRRGFKTEANEIAREIRSELGISELERLDPRHLAEHLEIPIVAMSELVRSRPAIRHLIEVESNVFSAATVFDGPRRLIVHNDGHSEGRQNSNLCHELAHGLLLHPPTPALDDRGCRHWNQLIEDEANWLCGVLLVSEAATLEVAKGAWSKEKACDHLGVSQRMLQFRINSTGALIRVQRMRHARRR